MPKLEYRFMNTRSTIRILALLACALVLTPDIEAQRGGRGGGRGGKAKQAAKNVIRNLIPKPLPPIVTPKLPTSTKTKSALPDQLLPSAGAPPLAGSVAGTDISRPDKGNYVLWTDPLDPELEEYYFTLCDHDSNTWISYREGTFSLSLDRLQFTYYDSDRDGRIQRSEFAERYKLVVDRRGGFPPPKPHLTEVPEPFGLESSGEDGEAGAGTDESQLLERFDTDASAGLELGEIPPLIKLFLLSDHIQADQLLGVIDQDLTSAIEMAEMPFLIEGLAYAQVKFIGSAMPVQSLLGIESAPAPVLAERAAPLTIEHSLLPKSHFERLDQNGDGYIGTEDLRTLQSPMHLSVRTNAVIAAMDTDGDGKISDAEFAAAFK
ncbi:MAG: hypothetical protein ACI8TQ_001811 [Planctomycetota bacterium]|jgi:hypothetical protein